MQFIEPVPEKNIQDLLEKYFSMLAMKPEALIFEVKNNNGFLYIEMTTPYSEDVGKLLGKHGLKKQSVKAVLGMVLKNAGVIKTNDNLELKIYNVNDARN